MWAEILGMGQNLIIHTEAPDGLSKKGWHKEEA